MRAIHSHTGVIRHLALFISIVSSSAFAGNISPGTVVIVNASGENAGALYSIDPVSKKQTLLSRFSDAAQGVAVINPVGVALVPDARDGTKKVALADAAAGTDGKGAIIVVDPVSGKRDLLSDFGNPKQGPGVSPSSLVYDAESARLIATDPDAGSAQNSYLLSIDPNTGERTLLDDGGDSALGPLVLYSVALGGSSGRYFVADVQAGTGGNGALLQVDTKTRRRVLLSDLGDSSQGRLGGNPIALAQDTTGALGLGSVILVLDDAVGTDAHGALLSIDSVTGKRTQLCDIGRIAEAKDIAPSALSIMPELAGEQGYLLVLGRDGVIFRIEPATGVAAIWSDLRSQADFDSGNFSAMTVR